MKHLAPLLLASFLVFVIQSDLVAQNNKPNEQTRFSIEIDPATFVFKGYGVHLRIQPKGCDHLLIGAGAYAMKMPDLLINLNEKNNDKGWDVGLNQGMSVFAEHHFTEVNNKWFLGTQIGLQEFKIENSDQEGIDKFTNILTMGYMGYTFRPFNNGLYLKPWAGIGYTSKLSGNNILGDATYDIAPITMFVTLHMGYTF